LRSKTLGEGHPEGDSILTMKKARQEIIDMWNKTSDSDWYNSYRTDEAIHRIRQNPSSAFHPTTFWMLKEFFGDFKGKKILVPSSGDNQAVFAFCLLGAQVTSADISERQTFTRPFSDGDPAEQTKLRIEKPYNQTGVGINNHWRVQDLLNAILTAGLTIEHIEEMYPEFGTIGSNLHPAETVCQRMN
jgi:hypothetical protein